MIEFPGYSRIIEPKLMFDALSASPFSIHPLKGLLDFGPFSKSVIQSQMGSIKIAAIYPEGQFQVLKNLVSELKSTRQPQERINYLPAYPGFQSIYKIGVELVDEKISLPIKFDLSNTNTPHLTLSDTLTQAIRSMAQRKQDFDVLYIYLPDSWSPGFEKLEENFDLHDFLKGFTAIHNIPTQILRESSAIQYKCRCSVMWRLSIALYVKAGGIPWKLNSIDEETAFIGLSYATKLNKSTDQFDFITCCSQVFDSDGTGLEFIAYDVGEVQSRVGESPFLSRAEMRKVMSRSLALYQKRHTGRPPKKIIVHKTTEFKKDEVNGCFDAFPSNIQVELLQIKQDTDWRAIKGIRNNGKSEIDRFPVDRGCYLQLGHKEVLLWTQGIVNINGKSFYKEGKGIPAPLTVVRHAGIGGWDQDCNAILGLTKMNWNHDGLYDRLPVTLGYASVLATTIKRMSSLVNKPYEFRYFM